MNKYDNLMQVILSSSNMGAALSRGMGNKGAPGIDGMHVEELPLFLKVNWEEIKVKLLLGDYKPEAVRGVEIPKSNGGKHHFRIKKRGSSLN